MLNASSIVSSELFQGAMEYFDPEKKTISSIGESDRIFSYYSKSLKTLIKEDE